MQLDMQRLKAISENALFQATGRDKRVKYDPEAWQYRRQSFHSCGLETP